jgi:hypothetical protein
VIVSGNFRGTGTSKNNNKVQVFFDEQIAYLNSVSLFASKINNKAKKSTFFYKIYLCMIVEGSEWAET